jgi:hypothetical protein
MTHDAAAVGVMPTAVADVLKQAAIDDARLLRGWRGQRGGRGRMGREGGCRCQNRRDGKSFQFHFILPGGRL